MPVLVSEQCSCPPLPMCWRKDFLATTVCKCQVLNQWKSFCRRGHGRQHCQQSNASIQQQHESILERSACLCIPGHAAARSAVPAIATADARVWATPITDRALLFPGGSWQPHLACSEQCTDTLGSLKSIDSSPGHLLGRQPSLGFHQLGLSPPLWVYITAAEVHISSVQRNQAFWASTHLPRPSLWSLRIPDAPPPTEGRLSADAAWPAATSSACPASPMM